jgi:type IV secretory pathway VirB3-like protein/type IV secretory pathway VirB2 component (pilin)
VLIFYEAGLGNESGFFYFWSQLMKKSLKKIQHFIPENLFSFYFFIASLFPSLAFATGDTPVVEGLQYITNAMYGGTGVAIATIAVMVVGLLCLGHVLRWSALGYTIIGISIIFGAGSIVSGITTLIHNQ